MLSSIRANPQDSRCEHEIRFESPPKGCAFVFILNQPMVFTIVRPETCDETSSSLPFEQDRTERFFAERSSGSAGSGPKGEALVPLRKSCHFHITHKQDESTRRFYQLYLSMASTRPIREHATAGSDSHFAFRREEESATCHVCVSRKLLLSLLVSLNPTHHGS
jgi:hypothetical protein